MPANNLRAISGFMSLLGFCREAMSPAIINALSTRSLTAHGRTKGQLCRAGRVGQVETVNHVSYQCSSSHKVDRHDNLVGYLESHLPIGDTYLKPDIVAVKGGTASVIDVQVVLDSRSLDLAHDEKVRNYNRAELINAIKNRFKESNMFVTSCTLNVQLINH